MLLILQHTLDKQTLTKTLSLDRKCVQQYFQNLHSCVQLKFFNLSAETLQTTVLVVTIVWTLDVTILGNTVHSLLPAVLTRRSTLAWAQEPTSTQAL